MRMAAMHSLKTPSPLDDEVVGALEAVEVDVPIHPLVGCDDGGGLWRVLGILDGLDLGGGDEFLGEEDLQLGQDVVGIVTVLGGEVVARIFLRMKRPFVQM